MNDHRARAEALDVERRVRVVRGLGALMFLVISAGIGMAWIFEIGSFFRTFLVGITGYLAFGYSVRLASDDVDDAVLVSAVALPMMSNLSSFSSGTYSPWMIFAPLCYVWLGALRNQRWIPVFLGVNLLMVALVLSRGAPSNALESAYMPCLFLLHLTLAFVSWWTNSGTSFVDLTEARLRMEEAVLDAQAANRAKSDFLANMSHELRTPLNAILGYAEIVEDDLADRGVATAESTADLARIGKSGRHLLGLINDLLDLTKVEAGQLEMVVESVELEPLVADVLLTAQPLVKPGVVTISEVSPGIVARTDRVRTRQILLNLLSNATKFTKSGSIRVLAEIGAEDILVHVVDTGPGIPQHIFGEFNQASAKTSHEHGGTGLGLSLSRRFARALGGELHCESVPGEGATFVLRLQRAMVLGDAGQVENA